MLPSKVTPPAPLISKQLFCWKVQPEARKLAPGLETQATPALLSWGVEANVDGICQSYFLAYSEYIVEIGLVLVVRVRTPLWCWKVVL